MMPPLHQLLVHRDRAAFVEVWVEPRGASLHVSAGGSVFVDPDASRGLKVRTCASPEQAAERAEAELAARRDEGYDEPTPREEGAWRRFSGVVCSPDGALVVASAGQGAWFRIFHGDTGKARATLPFAASCASFSGDGRYLAVGAGDGVVRVYNTTTWAMRKRRFGTGVRSVALSADGRELEVSWFHEKIRQDRDQVVEVATWRALRDVHRRVRPRADGWILVNHARGLWWRPHPDGVAYGFSRDEGADPVELSHVVPRERRYNIYNAKLPAHVAPDGALLLDAQAGHRVLSCPFDGGAAREVFRSDQKILDFAVRPDGALVLSLEGEIAVRERDPCSP